MHILYFIVEFLLAVSVFYWFYRSAGKKGKNKMAWAFAGLGIFIGSRLLIAGTLILLIYFFIKTKSTIIAALSVVVPLSMILGFAVVNWFGNKQLGWNEEDTES